MHLTTRSAAFTLLVLAAAGARSEVPPRTPAGQTLAVPEADFESGQVYYLLPGEDTQLVLTSAAPLQRTLITTSRAVGYVIATFDPEDAKQPITAGALRVPVASLASDSPATDDQLWGKSYFDGAEHPEISFELTGATAVERLAGDDPDVFAYRMLISGKLTARGVSREVEMTAEVRFLLTNFTTFNRAVGDLVTVAGRFEVNPGDFGWELPREAAGLVAPRLAVDVFLLGSTRSPENNLDPNLDLARWLAEQRYLTVARDLRDARAAAVAGGEFLAKYRDDGAALNSLARVILGEPGLRDRDLALARQLVRRAAELDAEGKDIAETRALLAAALGEASK